jgi:hypothetical protein
MNICLCGASIRNKTHGAEVGVQDALVELGHSVALLDFGAKTSVDINGQYDRGDHTSIVNHIKMNYDFILTMGAGLPVGVSNNKDIQQFFNDNLSVLWSSEPLRLPNYRERITQQQELFDIYFSFDEGECPIYENITNKPCFFLAQGYFPKWYKPIWDPRAIKKVACFVGSINNEKWCNRQHFIKRAYRILGQDNLTVTTIFNAKKVNEIYNKHFVVLNLGLYHKELGAPQKLASFGFQERVMQAIGAGVPCLTHKPADLNNTPEQQKMFTNGATILYYTNDNFDAILRHFFNNPAAADYVAGNKTN